MDNVVQLRRRSAVCPALASLLGALLFVSCGKQASDSTKSSAPQSQASATTASVPPPVVVAGPGPDEKTCFQCNGTGTVACRAPGCKEGKTDCPAGCLKLSKGVWIHMDVAGHDPSELWQKFPNASGKGGYQAWNHHHVGEVVVYQNGVAVNIGKCKVCGGATTATCPACKGQGRQACEICAGKQFVPLAWTPTDNPWFNRQPDVIRLKDGQVILGRVAASVGEDKTIVTRDKKVIHVNASDILPRPDPSSPADKSPPPR